MMVIVNATLKQLSALDRSAQRIALGAGRIIVGLMWLANIHWKVPPDFGQDTGGGLYKYSASVERHSPFAPFTWATENIILPNFTAFGWITLVTEIVLAALLLIGYKTRIVALIGAMFTIPIFLSVIYYDNADEWSWAYFLMFAAHILLYGSDAGKSFGVDGVIARGSVAARATAAQRATVFVGALTTAIALAGLYVARSVDFVGDQVALLGSDAGFTDGDRLVRRWELKFLWFNGLWALLMLVAGILILAAIANRWAARAGATLMASIAVVLFVIGTFGYLRGDGIVQTVATGSNVAVWAGLALAVFVLDRLVGAADESEHAGGD